MGATTTPSATWTRPATWRCGDTERAALLSGAAEGLRQRVGIQLWPILRRRRAHVVGEVRAALGDARFDRAYTAGTQLNQREAVAVARLG